MTEWDGFTQAWCRSSNSLWVPSAPLVPPHTHLPRQWFLELWDASHAVLGVIAIIAIQRAIQKLLIAFFITREFKHDETNQAWWTGKWIGRGFGAHAMSQPAREFLVKIVELSLWSGDMLLAHFLLLILTPPVLIPYVDRVHATSEFSYFLLLSDDIDLMFRSALFVVSNSVGSKTR